MTRITRTLTQINLQRHFGGGEVYTRFLTVALAQLGCTTRLITNPKARFWHDLHLPDTTTLIPVNRVAEIAAHLPARQILLTHGPISDIAAQSWHDTHRVFGIAHMPLYGRDPRVFDRYHGIFAVSQYVLDSLRAAGLSKVFPEPLYGVADLARLRTATAKPIAQTSCYAWDVRKGRDRLFSWFETLIEPLRQRANFVRRPGLSLGIVSRLTPIKQFPLLLQYIAPILADFPSINLEIFGAGGYASVRDLRQALTPIAAQTRFWGHQQDVASVYRQLDFVLSGLPEKEALGLNMIEAQACNTPVLAIDAPPFCETVLHGKSGFLYPDPRSDQGVGWRALLTQLTSQNSYPQPLDYPSHLERFSCASFVQGVARALDFMEV